MKDKDIKQYEFFRKLTSLDFVDCIFLYGSRGRGDNQPRSDIDLAIGCATATLHDWNTVMEIIEQSDTLLEIDCVRFDELQDDDPLKKNIMNEASLLDENQHEIRILERLIFTVGQIIRAA